MLIDLLQQLLDHCDAAWRSRITSTIGLLTIVFSALSTAPVLWLFKHYHVPDGIFKDIQHVNAWLILAGAALMARGSAVLGGEQRK